MGTLATLWQEHRTMMVFFIVLIVVIPFLIFYLNKAKKEHPKGLIAAALSNMGERFGYYIMTPYWCYSSAPSLAFPTERRASFLACSIF